MLLLEIVTRLYESGSPGAAVRALGDALPARAPLRLVAWVGRQGELREGWPAGVEPPRAVVEEALRAPAPAVSPLPAGEALLLPLSADDGALLLLASADAAWGEPAGWERVRAAFARLVAQEARLRQAETDRDALRQRAEESEALHVLGLAANRTLDPDEVLALVARFTRTLLGAHYVAVSTSDHGRIEPAAAVGLRDAALPPPDDHFAAAVVGQGKPLTVQPERGDLPLERLPFHAAQGMCTGLGVPLSLFGETFGALVIGYRRPYQLGPRDTRLALALAGHATVAISNARLHRALANRSRELESAYEELRWSAQAKERFFATMSHELRTPLNAILGYQSLLLDGIAGEVDPRQRAYLENAHRATRTLLVLVNDVLDLSKIEAGKMQLFIRPVSLGQVVHEALATIRPIAEAKEIRVSAPRRGALPTLNTDHERLGQILLNLLSNAVKFTEAGEIDLQVESVETAGTPWVEVRVSDTGMGIAPEDQERIFQEFEQIAGASSRGGTGLGLPISRKLAQLLGGDLRVRSAPGRGSTFVLRLPLAAPLGPGMVIADL